MRAASPVVLALALALAACGGGDPAPSASGTPAAANSPAATPSPAAPAPAPSVAEVTGDAVRGTVLADQPVALTQAAQLTVRLLDITRVDGEPIKVAEQAFPITGLPVEFALPYDSALVNPIRSYAVEAAVSDNGQVVFVSNGRIGVLTQGKPETVTVQVSQAMAAAAPKDPVAELNQEFADFEARLGNFKRFADSRIVGPEGSQLAIGYDAFADETGVRMVRETVSNAEGTERYTRRFAFKEGKLWVAVREQGGSSVKLGFDPEGNVVVAQRNNAVDESAAKQADELKRAAKDAFAVASAKAG